jgi:DNA-binding MltR family transcriptional regulator
MATSQAAKRLRKLADQIPEDRVVWDALQVLLEDHSPWADHAIALLGSSYVEKALELSIKSRFLHLNKSEQEALFSFEKHGPLSDLSSRIKMAYALDIIGPRTRDDLEHMRTVRNAFAHALTPVGFEITEVSDICEILFTHNDMGLLGRWAGGESSWARYINTTLGIATKLKNTMVKRDVMVMHDGRAFPVRFLP